MSSESDDAHLDELDAWANKTKYHIRVGYEPEPNAPFLTVYSYPRVNKPGMFTIIFEDLMCMDIDVTDASMSRAAAQMAKEAAASQLADFAQERMLRFTVYETNKGLHAFCTSHRLKWDCEATHQIMRSAIAWIDGVDKYYFAFSKTRAFSMRLSPKFSGDFVRRPWTDDVNFESGQPRWGDAPAALGALRNKIQLLNLMTNYTCMLYDKGVDLEKAEEIDGLLISISRYSEALLVDCQVVIPQCGDVNIPQIIWVNSCRTPGNQWTHRDPGDEQSDAKVVVFRQGGTLVEISANNSSRGRWKYRDGQNFSEPYTDRKAAKRAAISDLGLSPQIGRPPGISSRQKKRLIFGDVKRYGDRCFACGKRGHWAGDDECSG